MREHRPEGGSPVLNIGGDVGALVIESSRTTEGHEIEIRRLGTSWAGEHSVVHRRALGNGHILYAAVFPELLHGYYEVRMRAPHRPEPSSRRTVLHVRQARVTEINIGG
jgi:hypothetical protein